MEVHIFGSCSPRESVRFAGNGGSYHGAIRKGTNIDDQLAKSLRSIVRDPSDESDGRGSMSGQADGRHCLQSAGKDGLGQREQMEGQWAHLLPELLLDVMRRVEAGGAAWPARRQVVVCAAVCQSCCRAIKEVVRTLEECGRITFPVSLKQPAPRENPVQCFVKRDRATSTYLLYLGLPSLHEENDKLLLAAHKSRRATSTEFVISLSSNDFFRSSSTYIGKLKSNFLGMKFTVLESELPCDAAVLRNNRPRKRIHYQQVSPRLPPFNYNIATILYELTVLRSRGPRRMQCTMHTIPSMSITEGGKAPTLTGAIHSLDEQLSTLSISKGNEPSCVEYSSTSLAADLSGGIFACSEAPLVLKNKSPRWHEQLQCWCLNFRGRVTIASVKNFQLFASVDPSLGIPDAEQEKVILQFGKIGKDTFTMDYRYPLSAFQSFAICLTSFDNKPACE